MKYFTPNDLFSSLRSAMTLLENVDPNGPRWLSWTLFPEQLLEWFRDLLCEPGLERRHAIMSIAICLIVSFIFKLLELLDALPRPIHAAG